MKNVKFKKLKCENVKIALKFQMDNINRTKLHWSELNAKIIV